MLGRRFADFQAPEHAERDLALFARLLEGKPVKGHETVHLHKLGHPVHLVFSAKAHLDGEGRVAGTRGTAHDVTAAKRLEAELRRSQESYRRMFEDMPLAFCTAAIDFRFRETNPAFQRLFGYSADELRAMTFRDLTLPEQVPRDRAAIERLVRGELPVYRTTKRYRTKSGRLLWGLFTVSGVRDEHGKVRYCLAGVEDITEIKEAEELLAEAQRIGELGSYDYDVRAGTWTSSPKLDEILGIDDAYPRDVPGWLALIHPEDREAIASHLEQALARAQTFDRVPPRAATRRGRGDLGARAGSAQLRRRAAADPPRRHGPGHHREQARGVRAARERAEVPNARRPAPRRRLPDHPRRPLPPREPRHRAHHRLRHGRGADGGAGDPPLRARAGATRARRRAPP
jgi:PAS domain S-box-containing protein